MPRPRFPIILPIALLVAAAGVVRADPPAPPPVFDKALPESIDDLKAMQTHVKAVVDHVMPCVVGLQIGGASGSGVIVSKEGYILTAGHVSGEPGRPAIIILHDGRKLKGVTLGANNGIDSGMVRITEGEYPSLDLARTPELKKGQWVIAIGHPGGWQPGRAPVVRVGRVLEVTKSLVRSDCTLVGGDSGGPLFDVAGRVVGIHSRIGGAITYNIHVPVATYRETWEKLVAGETWGTNPLAFLFGNPPDAGAYLGIRPDPDAKAFKILSIAPDSPAAKAGVQLSDVLLKIDGRAISTPAEFNDILKAKRPGNQIVLHLRRGSEEVTVTVTLGKRPG